MSLLKLDKTLDQSRGNTPLKQTGRSMRNDEGVSYMILGLDPGKEIGRESGYSMLRCDLMRKGGGDRSMRGKTAQ